MRLPALCSLLLSLPLAAVNWAAALAWNDPFQAEAALYSSICYHVEAGDLLGERVILLNARDSHFVVYQRASGEFRLPIWGRAEIKDGQLTFSVQDQDGKILAFRGTVSPDEISGTFANGAASTNWGTSDFHWRRVSPDVRTTPRCDHPGPGK